MHLHEKNYKNMLELMIEQQASSKQEVISQYFNSSQICITISKEQSPKNSLAIVVLNNWC